MDQTGINPPPSSSASSASSSSSKSRWLCASLTLACVLSYFVFFDESSSLSSSSSTSLESSSLLSRLSRNGVVPVGITTTTTATTPAGPVNYANNTILQQLQVKLRPRKLRLMNDSQVVLNQFLHLHHMKTGGTSMDGLIQCGMQRLKQVAPSLSLSYSSIHECSTQHYQKCITGQDVSCTKQVQNAGILSYCAPLRDLPTAFGWNLTTHTVPAAITVLRHPVQRVWSMFRFQTKSCYHCRPLLDIYAEIDAAASGQSSSSTLTDICRMQLLNHQTRNLLAEMTDYPDNNDQAQAAIRNMHEFFTMVGLTDDMVATAKMVQHVFPWLAETFDWENAIQSVVSADSNSSRPVNDRSSNLKCNMGHQNASPQNNHCLEGNKHWALPDTPDEATVQAILRHNQVDMQVYEAAVQLFELQKQALGID